MRRFIPVLGLASLLAFMVALVPATTHAFSTKSGSTVTVSKSDTTQGSLYISGQTVTIDGDVNGDLFCAGSVVNVNGNVKGDVICAAQTITINGTVGGNVRVAGQTVNLNSTVARNATIFAQTFYMNPEAKITGDLMLYAQTASVYGTIGGELYGAAESLSLGSTIAGDVNMTVSSLSLSSSAAIGGNLTYTSEKELSVDKTKVTGSVTFKQATTPKPTKSTHAFNWGAWIFGRLYSVLAAYVVAFVILWIAPKPLRRLTGTMLKTPLPALGWGFLALLVIPFALLLIAITIIGLPLALLFGLLWAIAMGLSGLVASVAVGRWIVRTIKWNPGSMTWSVIIGVPVGYILMGVPFLGFFLGLAAIWWTLGAFGLNVRYLRD